MSAVLGDFVSTEQQQYNDYVAHKVDRATAAAPKAVTDLSREELLSELSHLVDIYKLDGKLSGQPEDSLTDRLAKTQVENPAFFGVLKNCLKIFYTKYNVDMANGLRAIKSQFERENGETPAEQKRTLMARQYNKATSIFRTAKDESFIYQTHIYDNPRLFWTLNNLLESLASAENPLDFNQLQAANARLQTLTQPTPQIMPQGAVGSEMDMSTTLKELTELGSSLDRMDTEIKPGSSNQ